MKSDCLRESDGQTVPLYDTSMLPHQDAMAKHERRPSFSYKAVDMLLAGRSMKL